MCTTISSIGGGGHGGRGCAPAPPPPPNAMLYQVERFSRVNVAQGSFSGWEADASGCAPLETMRSRARGTLLAAWLTAGEKISSEGTLYETLAS